MANVPAFEQWSSPLRQTVFNLFCARSFSSIRIIIENVRFCLYRFALIYCEWYGKVLIVALLVRTTDDARLRVYMNM